MKDSRVPQERLPDCRGCVTLPEDDQVAITENAHDGYQCRDCGLIYVSPKPDSENIVNLYDHDSAQVSAQEWIGASESYGRSLKARLTLELIRSHRPSGDLLEIGAGGGAFLRQAATYFNVHAAEFNPAQVEYMQGLGIDCRRGAFAEVFEGMTFDVIYHCDVLSHFFDPIAEFRAMRRMLKPGGIVVFETGNFGDVERQYYHLVDRWQYPDHLYFFSRRSLSNLASASGFEIEMLREYSRSLEFRVGRLLKPAKILVKQRRRPSSGVQNRASSGGIKRSFVNWLMTVKHVVDYVMIYQIGAFLPKTGRPQTIIAVLKVK
jgi:2-polyprenyl-3-methyl-5-hydroxy-6-metoxy-1,4-benzoquinol methylase